MEPSNVFKPPEHDGPRPLRSENKQDEDDADTWQIVEPLYRTAGYLRIIGLLFLVFCVFGIIESLKNNNIFALILVAFPLWAALALIQGGKQIQEAYREGHRKKFKRAAEKVRVSAIISAWIMVAYILLIAALTYIFPSVL